jgi:hypothetical protein
MASCFESWTVLPHSPVEKLAPNLWAVRGKMPNGKTPRVMTVARYADGRLAIHNAIALDEPEMKELEAWGTPAVLLVPNGFHRQDAKIWKDRYPGLRVFAPQGSRKRVSQVVKLDGAYPEAPQDESVRVEQFTGCPSEGALVVRSNGQATIVFNDAVCNLPKLGLPGGFFMHPTGRASVPRVMRWLAVKDKTAFRAQVERLADEPGLCRVIVGHGRWLESAPRSELRAALDAL